MQFFDNNCLSHQKLCFAYASASQKENNCASHDCCVPHHCRLVSNLFEIRHAKHLWFPHAKKNIPSHITRPPFKLATSGDVQSKTKTVPPATHISSRKSCIMQVKKQIKRLFGFGCSMRHAKKTNMLRGPSFQHELRPKWPLPVLCYTHRLLSS